MQKQSASTAGQEEIQQRTYSDADFHLLFQSILSINDIESILNPLAKRFFNAEGDFNLTTVYEEVFSLERDEVKI